MNPLGIDQPCFKIASNELLFEKYRIALKRDKDAIDIDGNDAINSHQLVFDFVLRMFDYLNQLYEMEKSLLIDAILKYHLRNESNEENLSEPSSSRKESDKENTPKPSPSRKESVEENTSKPSPSRKESAKENTSNPSPSSKESVEKIHQSLLRQGKIVLSKIHQSLLLQKVVLRTRLKEIVKQIVTPTLQI